MDETSRVEVGDRITFLAPGGWRDQDGVVTRVVNGMTKGGLPTVHLDHEAGRYPVKLEEIIIVEAPPSPGAFGHVSG